MVKVGDIYTDEGASAVDFENNTLDVATKSSPGPVDTSKAGSYTILYLTSDSSGVTASAERTITINPVPTPEDTATSTPPTPPETPVETVTPPTQPTPQPEPQGSISGTGSFVGGYAMGYITGGQVLGASAPCGKYLTRELRPLQDNDPEDVIKLQALINEVTGANIPMTGIFGHRTLGALKEFQIKYRSTIIDPWVEKGLITNTRPTGLVGTTTLWTINNLVCPSLQLPKPVI